MGRVFYVIHVQSVPELPFELMTEDAGLELVLLWLTPHA